MFVRPGDRKRTDSNRLTIAMHDCDVIVLGDYFFDIIITGLKELPRLGADIFGDQLEMAPGGAYITTVALHRLGIHAEWVAHLGNDVLSEFVIRAAQKEGLCELLFKRHDIPLRKLSVSFSYPHDRGFISYCDGFDSDYPVEDIVARSPAWVVNPPLGGEKHIQDFLHAIHAAGSKIYLDSQFVDYSLDVPGVGDTLGLVDIFTCNQSEAHRLTGCSEPQQAAAVLANYCPMVIVKCGGNGAYARAGTSLWYSPALPVQVVDTTGAGDSFNAGFLAGVLKKETIETCLRYGNICGSLSTTRCGGASAAPTLEQLLAWL